MVFHVTVPLNVCHRVRGGGVAWLNRENAAKPLPSIFLIPLWLAILKQPSPCVPGAHVENDESDPPKNRGVMRPFVASRCDNATIRPHVVALVLIYPCGKAWNSPQERR